MTDLTPRPSLSQVWFCAAGSRDIATSQCIKLKRPLWRQVLDLMGGRFAEISKAFDAMD